MKIQQATVAIYGIATLKSMLEQERLDQNIKISTENSQLITQTGIDYIPRNNNVL